MYYHYANVNIFKKTCNNMKNLENNTDTKFIIELYDLLFDEELEKYDE
jgi:hypothetical protein